jgi:hypothetical protein
MVCDFMELYRYLIDDFVIDYCRDLTSRDFSAMREMHGVKMAKRIFLIDELTDDCVGKLFKFFEKKFPIPSVRRGSRIKLNTIIAKEPFRMWVYIVRTNKGEWIPKIPIP